MNKNNRKFVFLPLLFLIFLGAFLITKPALAWDPVADASAIFGWLIMQVVSILGKILTWVIALLIKIAQYNGFITAPAVSKGWIIIRDLCNMFFIAALLVIAFGTVLRVEKYSYKRTLGGLLLAAVLINFSKFICGFFIDVAQILMLTFVKAFKDAAAGNFLQMLGMDKWLNFSGAQSGGYSAFTGSIFALILIIISLIVISIMMVILAFRIVIIWLLVVLSPLVFVLNIFPGKGQSYSNMWWEKFTNQLIVGPVMAFFIWLSFAVASESSIIPQTPVDTNEIAAQNVDLSDNSISEAANPSNFAKFVVSIAMLVGSLLIAQNLGVAGGKLAGKAVGKMQAYATGQAGFTKKIRDRVESKVKDAGKVAGATGKALVGAGGAMLGKGLLEGGKKIGLRKVIEGGERLAKLPAKGRKKAIDWLNKGKQKRADAVSKDGTKGKDGKKITAGFWDKVLNTFDRNFDKFGGKDISIGQVSQSQRVKDTQDRLSTKSEEELRALAKLGSAAEKMAAAILLAEKGSLKGNTDDNQSIIKTAQMTMAGNPILGNQFDNNIKKNSDADLVAETQYNNFENESDTKRFNGDVREGKIDLGKLIPKMDTTKLDNLIAKSGGKFGEMLMQSLSGKEIKDLRGSVGKERLDKIYKDYDPKGKSEDEQKKYVEATGRIDKLSNPNEFIKNQDSSFIKNNISPESLKDKKVVEAIIKHLSTKEREVITSTGENEKTVLSTLEELIKYYNKGGKANSKEAKEARREHIKLGKGKNMEAIYDGTEGTDERSEANRMNISHDLSQGISDKDIKAKDLEALDKDTLKERPEIGQAILKLDFDQVKEYVKGMKLDVKKVFANILSDMEENTSGQYTEEDSQHATDLLDRFGKIGNSMCSQKRQERKEKRKKKQ